MSSEARRLPSRCRTWPLISPLWEKEWAYEIDHPCTLWGENAHRHRHSSRARSVGLGGGAARHQRPISQATRLAPYPTRHPLFRKREERRFSSFPSGPIHHLARGGLGFGRRYLHAASIRSAGNGIVTKRKDRRRSSGCLNWQVAFIPRFLGKTPSSANWRKPESCLARADVPLRQRNSCATMPLRRRRKFRRPLMSINANLPCAMRCSR